MRDHRSWFPSNQNKREYVHCKIYCWFCFPWFLCGLVQCLVHSICSINIYRMDGLSPCFFRLADHRTLRWPLNSIYEDTRQVEPSPVPSVQIFSIIKTSPGTRWVESTDFNHYLLPQLFLTPKEQTLSLELFVIVSDFWHSKRQLLV